MCVCVCRMGHAYGVREAEKPTTNSGALLFQMLGRSRHMGGKTSTRHVFTGAQPGTGALGSTGVPLCHWR